MKVVFIAILLGIAALGVWAVSVCCSTGSSPGSSAAGAADRKTASFHVDGMTCGGCEAGLKMALKKLDGVHEVKASYEKARAEVIYEPARVELEKIKAAIEELGYRAELETES